MKNGMDTHAQSAGGINQSRPSLHGGIASRVISLLRHVLMQVLPRVYQKLSQIFGRLLLKRCLPLFTVLSYSFFFVGAYAAFKAPFTITATATGLAAPRESYADACAAHNWELSADPLYINDSVNSYQGLNGLYFRVGAGSLYRNCKDINGYVIRGSAATAQYCYGNVPYGLYPDAMCTTCPQGSTQIGTDCVQGAPPPIVKNLGAPTCYKDMAVGNPVLPSTGIKFQSELDYLATGLHFKRYYNSSIAVPVAKFGKGWRGSLIARLLCLPRLRFYRFFALTVKPTHFNWYRAPGSPTPTSPTA